jgi:hypothetical protein
MEIDAKTVADLWETIKEYVPANKREELALSFLEVFVNNDVDIEHMEDLNGVDDNLDTALAEVFGEEIDDEE